MAQSPQDVWQEWARAWREKDAASVARLMSDDFCYISPEGQAFNRDQMLMVIGDPTYSGAQGDRSGFSFRWLGTDAVLVRDHWRGKGEFRGMSFNDDHACSFIYERHGDSWQIVFEQCSAIAQTVA